MLPANSPFALPPAPGPHPATAELRAYAAGTLAAADEHRIEAHVLDCERCAELLEGFSTSDAATTDHALAELHTRLQARVANDVTAPLVLPASRPLWPRLAAGVVLLGAVGAGIWGWEHQRPAAEVAQAPRETAVPAAQPPQAAPATIAAAKPPQPAPLPSSATSKPTAAPSRPADYAAARPHYRASAPGLFRRSPAPAAPAITHQDAEVTEQAGLASSTTPISAPEAKKVAGRMAAAAAVEPATAAAADEAAAPAIAAAAPAQAPVLADSTTSTRPEAINSRFAKAKVVESAALVRDRPMPPAVAIAPAPVAGTPALNAYLRREAAKFMPEEGVRGLNGVVRLRFIVGADGKLSNLQVVRGMRADYDEEALRLVCEGPAWRPGIAGGRRAALPVEVTVSF